MREQTLISVIVPVYNILDCLERCVKSICGQTWENLEILLVDDGSSDGTEKLCDELAQKDGRIRVFHKENGGSSSARNLGIQEARGEWLGFVDSDDWIEPQMYERLLKAAVLSGVPIAQASRDEIDETGERRPDVCVPPKEEVTRSAEEFLRTLLLHEGDCSFCTKLVKKELFRGRIFPEGRLNEDFYLLVDMLGTGAPVHIVPEQMYHVFYRTGSNTRRKDKNDFSRVFVDIVDNADFIEGLVGKNYPSLQKEAVQVRAVPTAGLPASYTGGNDDGHGRVLPECETLSALSHKGYAYESLSDKEKQDISAASDSGAKNSAAGAWLEDEGGRAGMK